MRRSSKPDPADEAACRRLALDLLARREHSRLELERKLASRGFHAPVVAGALDRLEAAGALSAERFGASFVRSRIARGQGPLRIRMELEQRGVASDAAAELLGQAEVDWNEAAREVRRKRFGQAAPRDFKERARQARFLEQRGFGSSAIRAALDLGPDSD